MTEKILYTNYYQEGHWGHTLNDLTIVQKSFEDNCKPIIYLLGDSVLDNKDYIINVYYDAINGYEKILTDSHGNVGKMKPDVCYYLSKLMEDNSKTYGVINTAVIYSKLYDRQNNLFFTDNFASKYVTPNDIFVISLGIDDLIFFQRNIILWNMIKLIHFNALDTIKQGPDAAYGLNFFVKMFQDELQGYINKLLSNTNVKPKKIILCMFYFPAIINDTCCCSNWENYFLSLLDYNNNPEPIKESIRQIYQYAISKIQIDGIDIIPCPLYEVLDGSNVDDYYDRLGPSQQGGQKIAQKLYDIITNN